MIEDGRLKMEDDDAGCVCNAPSWEVIYCRTLVERPDTAGATMSHAPATGKWYGGAQ